MGVGPSTRQGYMYILAISGGKFLFNVKNGEEFEGGLKKGKENGGERRNEKEKSDKTHVKIPL